MSRLLPLALLVALAAAASVAIATASERKPARGVEWWRHRAQANRRLYRVEHRRWQLERAHRLRDKHARSVQAHAEKGGRPDAVAVGTNSPGITASSLSVADWRAKQIAAAETIGREALAAGRPDPWPNCADPIRDGAASWDVTVACENSSSWLDSPGYYRCGLQFDPMWEQRFGELCPP